LTPHLTFPIALARLPRLSAEYGLVKQPHHHVAGAQRGAPEAGDPARLSSTRDVFLIGKYIYLGGG